MESVVKSRISFLTLCEFCDFAALYRCGRCHGAFYCCKEHQAQHWPLHKKTCKKSSDVPLSANENQPTSSNLFPSSDDKSRSLNVSEKCSPNNRNVVVIEPDNNFDGALKRFIRDMNSLGVSVHDNLMGTIEGNGVLKEVKSLYAKGIFQKGKLITTHPAIPSEEIRSDVMTWIRKAEPEYPNISNLLHRISLLIVYCSKVPNRGILSRYKLIHRTRIMVACYPGNGTCYKRHVDNPIKDGRCITAVYYLNKDWNEAHGGILRTYPYFSSQHHDIEPIFDRLVMFWSNERVPHEVLPSFANRFAITIWFLEEDEWNEHRRKKIEESKKNKD